MFRASTSKPRHSSSCARNATRWSKRPGRLITLTPPRPQKPAHRSTVTNQFIEGGRACAALELYLSYDEESQSIDGSPQSVAASIYDSCPGGYLRSGGRHMPLPRHDQPTLDLPRPSRHAYRSRLYPMDLRWHRPAHRLL